MGTGKGAVVYINHYFHYMIITLKKNPTKLTFYVMVSKPPYFLFVSLLYFLKIIQDKNQENIEKKQKLGPKTKKTSKKPKIWTRNQKNIEKNKILDQTPKKHRENQRNQKKNNISELSRSTAHSKSPEILLFFLVSLVFSMFFWCLVQNFGFFDVFFGFWSKFLVSSKFFWFLVQIFDVFDVFLVFGSISWFFRFFFGFSMFFLFIV